MDQREPADAGSVRPGLQDIMPVVYAELKRLAAAQMAGERSDHTLQPTALVHEVYLRLASQRNVDWCNREQVLGIAARMMRRILVDHASSRSAAKRWGGQCRVAMPDQHPADAQADIRIMDLDRALTGLAELDPRQAELVELRFFGGLTMEEAARAIGMSEATAYREWATARLWLTRRIESGRASEDPGER